MDEFVAFPSFGYFFENSDTGISDKDFEKIKYEINDFDIIVGNEINSLHRLVSQSKEFDLIVIKPEIDFFLFVGLFKNKDSVLKHYRQYFELLRQLLTDNGSLYVHVSNLHLMSEFQVILDKVFGEARCVNQILLKTHNSSFKASKGFTKTAHEVILFYTKTDNFIWNDVIQTITDDNLAKKFPHVDALGQFRLMPLHVPGVRKHGETGRQWRDMNPPEGKHWRFSPEKMDELDQQGLIHWSRTGNPRLKDYVKSDTGVRYTDYWDLASAKNSTYQIKNLQKAYEVIIKSSTNEDSLILDAFSFDSVCLNAANNLNRKWIAVTPNIESFLFTLRYLEKDFCSKNLARAITTPEFISNEFANPSPVYKVQNKKFKHLSLLNNLRVILSD